MAMPESARGAVLDADRLLAFNFDRPVNVLILYNAKGQELTRIDHWWSLRRPRQRQKNTDQTTIRIVEDGTVLDSHMAAVESIRYQAENPTTLSEVYEVKVGNRPDAGRNREWELIVLKPKFKSEFFGSAALNR